MIYFVTVNYYSGELIAKLLRSIQEQVAQCQFTNSYRLIVVNNSPDDSRLVALQEKSVIILEAKKNLGFGGGCNLGLRWVFEQDRQAIAWLINPDATLVPNALVSAQRFCAAYPNLSIIGTFIHQPDGKVWFAGGEFNPGNGRIVAHDVVSESLTNEVAYIETAWVTGCSLLLNLTNFPECPQFDLSFFLYYEDFDFCRRYRQQGHSVVVTDRIQVIHQPSSITSRNQALKLQHSTYSYLLALEKHTQPSVLLYRLGRIIFHALRVSGLKPGEAIAIIKGVLQYGARVSRFGKFHRH